MATCASVWNQPSSVQQIHSYIVQDLSQKSDTGSLTMAVYFGNNHAFTYKQCFWRPWGPYNQLMQKLVQESGEPGLDKSNASFALKLFENNEQMITSNKTHCTQWGANYTGIMVLTLSHKFKMWRFLCTHTSTQNTTQHTTWCFSLAGVHLRSTGGTTVSRESLPKNHILSLRHMKPMLWKPLMIISSGKSRVSGNNIKYLNNFGIISIFDFLLLLQNSRLMVYVK